MTDAKLEEELGDKDTFVFSADLRVEDQVKAAVDAEERTKQLEHGRT